MTKVSIIIVTYKSYDYLKSCLSSITGNYEIIVYDNCPQKNNIKKLFPKVKYISDPTNPGYAAANNNAAKIATGDYLFLLNPDTKILPSTIPSLLKTAKPNQISACQIQNYSGQKTHHCGIGVDIFGFPVNNGKIFYAEGSALFISKNLFNKLGGFDNRYFMFHEDIDLCWRAWLSGAKVICQPQAKICHAIGSTSGGTTPSKKQPYRTTLLRRYYAERNNICTLLKNYQPFTLLFILPIYLLINLFEIIFLPKLFLYYLKAYAWNIINLPQTLRLRQNRQISDFAIFKKMSFIPGKLINLLKLGLPKIK